MRRLFFLFSILTLAVMALLLHPLAARAQVAEQFQSLIKSAVATAPAEFRGFDTARYPRFRCSVGAPDAYTNHSLLQCTFSTSDDLAWFLKASEGIINGALPSSFGAPQRRVYGNVAAEDIWTSLNPHMSVRLLAKKSRHGYDWYIYVHMK
jgi:hypothetical protein